MDSFDSEMQVDETYDESNAFFDILHHLKHFFVKWNGERIVMREVLSDINSISENHRKSFGQHVSNIVKRHFSKSVVLNKVDGLTVFESAITHQFCNEQFQGLSIPHFSRFLPTKHRQLAIMR